LIRDDINSPTPFSANNIPFNQTTSDFEARGLDFNIYPRGVWDEADAIINGWRIDIKATRPGAKWMLIELGLWQKQYA
jgi:hypothetical protein